LNDLGVKIDPQYKLYHRLTSASRPGRKGVRGLPAVDSAAFSIVVLTKTDARLAICGERDDRDFDRVTLNRSIIGFSSPKLKVLEIDDHLFWGQNLYVSFSMPSHPYPQLPTIKYRFLHWSHPTRISNISPSFANHSIVPRKQNSDGKISSCDRSHLIDLSGGSRHWLVRLRVMESEKNFKETGLFLMVLMSFTDPMFIIEFSLIIPRNTEFMTSSLSTMREGAVNVSEFGFGGKLD
jgi:hypothetical protein